MFMTVQSKYDVFDTIENDTSVSPQECDIEKTLRVLHLVFTRNTRNDAKSLTRKTVGFDWRGRHGPRAQSRTRKRVGIWTVILNTMFETQRCEGRVKI